MRVRRFVGLTLIEVLVTVGLLGLILQIAALTITDLSKSTQSQRIREDYLIGLAGLERMKEEVLEAVQIISPTGVGSRDVLEFDKVDTRADRLPSTPVAWIPRDLAHLSRVRYHPEGLTLRRREVSSQGIVTDTLIVEDIDAFLVSRPQGQVVEFRYSFRVGKRLRSFTSRVMRYLP